MSVKFSRKLNPHKRRHYGFSTRLDKVIILEPGHPLYNVELEGGITRITSKHVEEDFTGIGSRRKAGIDIDYLLSIQPPHILELMAS